MQIRSVFVFFGWTVFTAAGFSMSGCASDADTGDVGSSSQEIALQRGVDYSWSRPSPSGLRSAGYTFAVRYLSYDTSGSHGKILFKPEAEALTAAGVDIVANWEWGADDALDGYNGGVEDAREALRVANNAGMPAGRPIYFSVDFDATPGQQATINSYFDGVISVLGRDRVGGYGGYYVIKRLFDAGKITWGWQTYAWSGGQWDSRAQLRQVQNGVVVAGGEVDIDEAFTEDFGQWHYTGGGGGGGGGDCSVHDDHRLYCGNTSGAAMRATMSGSAAVVNHLQTSPSWFDCWGTGEQHAGGNTTWYHTLGDDTSTWGWLPGVNLNTTSAFDADPSAHGLPRCSLPPSNCAVQGDGKLHCGNTGGAAMYASTSSSSSVVNHLRTTTSWFDCWGTGEQHAGGNTTWYHTLGDDNGNWGWVPAVNLNTSSAFDGNPSYNALKKCN
ncbi:DUF1906 domain-containing protein [Pendulispora brunnea]|uniref:DUF1906 domain-containing protein n=1 Tax=Pendulispora brunnea TaxID=2905690 RepID=A0ABZ2K2E0_9BACT